MIWNTMYHITYQGEETLQDSILPVLNEVSASLSVFDNNSLVSRLNSSSSVDADKHLITVYKASKAINELSKGNFDPTVSPLIDAWGFGIGHKVSADTVAIDSIINFIGIRKTGLKDGKIYKEDIRTRFNFSAIAKGYGCDVLGEMFQRNGVSNFMIEIGGEVVLSGQSPSGTLWHIAVDAPFEGKEPGTESSIILALTNTGIATSGNYRNFREENGHKIAHTISPVTGRPIISEILSASIIAPTCMEADGLATACMAVSPSEAKELINNAKVEGLLIFQDSVWMSPGFTKYVYE